MARHDAHSILEAMNMTEDDDRPVSRIPTATGARWLSLALGIWLFISAFAWPHNPVSRANTWILGVIIAVVAAIAQARPVVRWVNTAASVWLFIATLAVTHATYMTMWNNLIVAVVVFLLSFVRGEGARTPVGNRTILPT
jgi:hypothetical protein